MFYQKLIILHDNFSREGTMKIRLCLKPGQRGTKRLTDKYGDALVCVRFRYDPATRQRLKTVELIVECTKYEKPDRANKRLLKKVRL
jgi:hypothetical protein